MGILYIQRALPVSDVFMSVSPRMQFLDQDRERDRGWDAVSGGQELARRAPTEVQRRRRAQRRAAASTFRAPPAPALPAVLRDCALVRRILRAPCEERLRQFRYSELSSQQYNWVGEREITYSLLTSIVTALVRSDAASGACVAGRASLVVAAADPDADEAQRVIPQASVLLTDAVSTDPARCERVYVPLDVYWATSPQLQARARREGAGFQCNQCPGHAMALLIDNRERTIEVYDPNGPGATWFRPIERFLLERLRRQQRFAAYASIAKAGQCVTRDPRIRFSPSAADARDFAPAAARGRDIGPQYVASLPMCAYFSNLYALLRLTCDDLDAAQVNDALVGLGRARLVDLLQRFHCFLVDYAIRSGLFEDAEALPELYYDVVNLLGNFALKRRAPLRPREYYERRLEQTERGAFHDVGLAVERLRALERQLREEFQNERIRFY